MALVRVPYPAEPDRRQAAFDRLAKALRQYGSIQGTPEAGTFRASTPVGAFEGAYSSPQGQAVLEIEVIKKPWLVGMPQIESEIRKLLGSA